VVGETLKVEEDVGELKDGGDMEEKVHDDGDAEQNEEDEENLHDDGDV
jgi:hypothetical protein